MSDEIKRTGRKLIYKGAILSVYKDYIEFPNGGTAEWDFIQHDGAAAVVPVMEDGRILMVRQFRNALDRETLEIPAGKLDAPDEPGLECSKRELEEETGYRSGDLEFLISLKPTVAYDNEFIDIYVAKNLKPGRQHLDEHEYIELEPMDLDVLCERIFAGEIQDAKTVAALLAYKIKYR